MWSSTAFDSFGMLKKHCSLAILFLLYVANNGFRLTWHAERSMLNGEDSLASQSVWILQRDNINFEFRYLTLNVIILTYVHVISPLRYSTPWSWVTCLAVSRALPLPTGWRWKIDCDVSFVERVLSVCFWHVLQSMRRSPLSMGCQKSKLR